jgi:predicted nucleic acid-binding protein
MGLFRNTLSEFEILPFDDDNMAVSYALIKSEPGKEGKKMPENDIRIAATCAYGLSAVGFDRPFSCLYVNYNQSPDITMPAG